MNRHTKQQTLRQSDKLSDSLILAKVYKNSTINLTTTIDASELQIFRSVLLLFAAVVVVV